jgi:hypothetical protein
MISNLRVGTLFSSRENLFWGSLVAGFFYDFNDIFLCAENFLEIIFPNYPSFASSSLTQFIFPSSFSFFARRSSFVIDSPSVLQQEHVPLQHVHIAAHSQFSHVSQHFVLSVIFLHTSFLKI